MVDPYAPEPLRDQVAALLRARIGELRRRDWLPSEASLAQEYEVSRDTIRAAMGLLRDEGLVVTIQGRGSYIA
ncbi:MAG: winged helix-turn-helix domain-containing protein [Streptosporangiaceae bacterium]